MLPNRLVKWEIGEVPKLVDEVLEQVTRPVFGDFVVTFCFKFKVFASFSEISSHKVS